MYKSDSRTALHSYNLCMNNKTRINSEKNHVEKTTDDSE